MPLRVLIADDNCVFLKELRRLLRKSNFLLVGEASDGVEALRLARKFRPDVAVLDLSMPLLNGLDAVRMISEVSPGTRTILLTVHREAPYVQEALKAGAGGYVVKSRAPEELAAAIRTVAQGATYVSREIDPVIA